MYEKDFLKGYEIRSFEPTRRMIAIFAIAAVLNFVAILIVGQTNMLARSACESPFVNRICTVLDTVYFSSKILTTDAGYVIKEYEETKIRESDVVWVDQTNVEPALQYPAGYFQIANKDELDLFSDDPFGGFPPAVIQPPTPITPPISPKTPSPFPKQNLPKKSDDLITGDFPDDTIIDATDGTDGEETEVKKPGEDIVADNSNSNTEEDSDVELIKPLKGMAPEIEINKKPLYDFVDGVVEKVKSNSVDLQRQFKVVMNAYIDEKGKLDVERSRWIAEEQEGDEEMILVAKDAVEKVGDSGWLIYLSDAGIKNIRIVFYQDEESLAADLTALMPSENRARSMSMQFSSWVQGAIFAHNNNLKTFKDDELTLLRAADFSSERNLLKINFVLKKDIAHPIINTRLQEYQADKERKEKEEANPKQPNGMVGKVSDQSLAR